jgi:DNA polymerase I-like protein with 3'-5' exonuclease and polymerase domains
MIYIWTSAEQQYIRKSINQAIHPNNYKILPVSPKIPTVGPEDVLLVCGSKAAEVLSSSGVIPKNRTLATLRGRVHKLNGSSVLITYDPKIISMDADKADDIIWDVRLARRLHDTGSTEPKVGKYIWVDDYKEVIGRILYKNASTGKAVPISIDLETLGLDPFALGVYIISISVTYEVGESYLIYFPCKKPIPKQIIEQMYWLNNDPAVKVRGANYKYDMLWQSVHMGITEFKSFTFDTNLVGSMLNENRSNSLNFHAKVYTDMGGYDDTFNATYDKSRMDLVPKSALLNYAGGDTDACLQVSNVMLKELNSDKKLKNFYTTILLPASQACRAMEQRGILVDKERYKDLRVEVVKELELLQAKAFGKMSNRIKMKYADNMSLTRDVILREHLFTHAAGLKLKPLLFTEKKKEPSTTLEHLELLAERHDSVKEFVDIMRDFNSAKKTLTTYIDGFMSHLRRDGRFHPTFMMYRGAYGDKDDDSGTVTGRTSAKDPAYQTIPKHTKWAKPLRRVYVPPPGYVHLNADYSQGELKIAACIANELSMIMAYLNGIDLHLITGCSVFGIPIEKGLQMFKDNDPRIGEIRQGGKAGNFGLIYGMGAAGFKVYARTSYGVELTDSQVSLFIEKFFADKPMLLEWHRDYKEAAHKYGRIRTPLGRLRHLPMINSSDNEIRAKQERQAINSPVQATLSDLGLWSMGILYKKYPELWCYGFTHDALTFYIKEDEVDIWAPRIKDVMENLPFEQIGWKPQLKFTIDIETSTDSLADLKKYAMTA